MHDSKAYRVRVCAAVRRVHDEILVVRESRLGEQSWNLPGGSAAFGESLEHALIREVREETGYDIVPTEIAYVLEERSERWTEPSLEICFYAEIIGRVEAAGPLGEQIRAVEWRSLGDEGVLPALRYAKVFLASRKGRYINGEFS